MAEGSSSRTVTPKMIIVGILVVVIIVLAAVNSQKITVDFVFDDFTIPLFLIIVGAALIGWVVGWFMGRHRDRDD